MAFNIELMFALILLLSATVFAYGTASTEGQTYDIISSVSHQDRALGIKQYMATIRATDNLVQDEGDSGWELNWISGQSSIVTKIGLNYNNIPKILNLTKIDSLTQGTNHTDDFVNTLWWEFPNSTSWHNDDNATRALGLEGYNFYMQLYPVDNDMSGCSYSFNKSALQIGISNVPINKGTASVVDRYVYIKDPSSGNFLQNNSCGKAIHYRLNVWVW